MTSPDSARDRPDDISNNTPDNHPGNLRDASAWNDETARAANEKRLAGCLALLSMDEARLSAVLAAPDTDLHRQLAADRTARGVTARAALESALISSLADYAVFGAAQRRAALGTVGPARAETALIFPGNLVMIAWQLQAGAPGLARAGIDAALDRLTAAGYEAEAVDLDSALAINYLRQPLEQALSVLALSDGALESWLEREGGSEEALEAQVADAALDIARVAAGANKLPAVWPDCIARIASVDPVLAGETARRLLNILTESYLSGRGVPQEDFNVTLDQAWKCGYLLGTRGYYYHAAGIAADLKMIGTVMDAPDAFRAQMDQNLSALMGAWSASVSAQPDQRLRAQAQAAIDELKQRHVVFQQAPPPSSSQSAPVPPPPPGP